MSNILIDQSRSYIDLTESRYSDEEMN
jgi:hypothetical protein